MIDGKRFRPKFTDTESAVNANSIASKWNELIRKSKEAGITLSDQLMNTEHRSYLEKMYLHTLNTYLGASNLIGSEYSDIRIEACSSKKLNKRKLISIKRGM